MSGGRIVSPAAVSLLAIASSVAAVLATGAAAGESAARTPRATSISATSGHTCSSMDTGEVECWGKSYLPVTRSAVPVAVPAITGVAAVSASLRYNCVLLQSHGVVCWGDNGYGQLGDGRTRDSADPVSVVGISSAVAISAGGYHACAVLASGGVRCWGRNLHGALGNGSMRDSSLPVRVSGITSAVAVSAGTLEDETCALLTGGAVRCWGANSQGQLGDGTTNSSDVPVPVKGVTRAVAVSAAGQHACAVLASGRMVCWGDNSRGELGDGSLRDSATPVAVTGITAASAVAAAPSGYTCAVVGTGAVYCWGYNAKNQLGNGLYPRNSRVPVRAVGISSAVAVTAGQGHACALLTTGGADCWGYDDYGQLGKGGGAPRISNPVAVRFGRSAPPAPPARAHHPTTRRPAVHAHRIAGKHRTTRQHRKR
jgi:alpha-tubulin suppressor-like RCC1 family protein